MLQSLVEDSMFERVRFRLTLTSNVSEWTRVETVVHTGSPRMLVVSKQGGPRARSQQSYHDGWIQWLEPLKLLGAPSHGLLVMTLAPTRRMYCAGIMSGIFTALSRHSRSHGFFF